MEAEPDNPPRHASVSLTDTSAWTTRVLQMKDRSQLTCHSMAPVNIPRNVLYDTSLQDHFWTLVEDFRGTTPQVTVQSIVFIYTARYKDCSQAFNPSMVPSADCSMSEG
jgi:hypothetical protein